MSTDVLTPVQVELLARLVRAYGTCPAPSDVPTIERLTEVLAGALEAQ